MNSQPNSHTHCQAAQANAQTKAWQRVCLSHPDKIELKKSSLPSENKKYATTQADTTKTAKRSIDNGLPTREKESQLITAVWRNGGFSASYDSFVVQQTVLLRINICGKNPPLRQAAKRCRQFFQTRQPNRKFNMNQDIFKEDRDYFLTLNWTFRRWTASPALKDKSVGGNTTLFTGQKYDSRYTEYVEDGWTHDHCEICKSYLTESDEITEQYGYTDNYHSWLCYECYRKQVTKDFVTNEFLLSDIVELSNDRVVLFVRPLVIGNDFRVSRNSKFGNVEITEHLDIPRKILDNGLQDLSTFTLVLKNKLDKDKLIKDNLYKLTD